MRSTLHFARLFPALCTTLHFASGGAQPVGRPATENAPSRNAGDVATLPENQPVARMRDRSGSALGPGEIGPLAPPTESDVAPALDFTITGYTTNQVALRWYYTRGPHTKILRSISGGPWEPIQTYETLPAKTYIDFQDQSARVNAENCYKISISDGVNPFSAQTTPIRCAMTREGRTTPVKVDRLQLRIQIANVANAGTDDSVEVRLQSPSWLVPTVTNWVPKGNSTWLDSTNDDFQRNSTFRYELMSDHISETSDITQVTLAKPGGDEMCVASVELLVNGQTGYRRDYGNDASHCARIGQDGVLSIGFEELRSSPTWAALTNIVVTPYKADDLRAVIMATFGNFIHGKGALRNGIPVTTIYANENRLKVAVPIKVYGVPLLGTVDSMVRFDLVVTNSDGKAHFTVEHVDADSSDLLGVFLPVIGWKILWETSQRIEAMAGNFKSLSATNPYAELTHICFQPDASVGFCPGD